MKVATAMAVLDVAKASYRLWRVVDPRGGVTSFDIRTWLFNDDKPWALPTYLYRVPALPLRIYLRIGDALLFRIWWATRPVVYRLADLLHFDPVVEQWLADARRAKVNAELARRDALGLAPDGGTFSADAEIGPGQRGPYLVGTVVSDTDWRERGIG
jgi:hypothetical protein